MGGEFFGLFHSYNFSALPGEWALPLLMMLLKEYDGMF